MDDVKKCARECKTCAEEKPKFYSPDHHTLIKATKPMERLNLDFKGPLPSSSRHTYFLCVIDEYSRYPFCFPCADTSATTIIACMESIFRLFGTCQYVHSDRGSSLMSRRFKDYLLRKGISSSRTTPYHPTGNAQCERYNGVIWRAVRCALKSRGMALEKWETVLSMALDSIRSLLCTSTGDTPHSRFFNFARRSCYGNSLPDWLCKPGPVYLRKFVRSGKNDDMVRKVELLDANPMYARVRYDDGRECNVSLRDIARCPRDGDGGGKIDGDGDVEKDMVPSEEANEPSETVDVSPDTNENNHDVSVKLSDDDVDAGDTRVNDDVINNRTELRRSGRHSKGVPPQRLEYV